MSFGYIALVVAVGGGACDQSGPLVGAGLHRREMAVPDEGPLPAAGGHAALAASARPMIHLHAATPEPARRPRTQRRVLVE